MTREILSLPWRPILTPERPVPDAGKAVAKGGAKR